MKMTDCCEAQKQLDDILDRMHEHTLMLMDARRRAEDGTVDPHHSEYTKGKFNEIYQILDLLLEGQ